MGEVHKASEFEFGGFILQFQFPRIFFFFFFFSRDMVGIENIFLSSVYSR
jgi:hypothetical protein